MPGSRATAGTAIGGVAGRPRTSSRPSHPVVVPRCGRTTTMPCGPVTPHSPPPTSVPATRRAAWSVARPTGRRRACCTRRPRGSSRSMSRHSPRTPSPPPSSRSGTSSCRSAWSPATIRVASPRIPTSRTPSRSTRGSPSPAACPCACMHVSATTPSRPRLGRATEVGRPSGATRKAERRWAGRSALPTARSGPARPPSWPTSSLSRIDRSRPTAAGVSG